MDYKNEKQIHWLSLSLLFSFGWVLIYFDRTMLTPIISDVLQEYNIGNNKIGLIFSLFFLGYTIFQIPGGILGEKIGITRTIKLCLVLFAFISFLSMFTTSFFMFIIYRMIAGSIEGLYYGPQFAYSSQYIKKKRKVFATTIINSGMSLGIILGTVIPTVLVIDKGVSYKYLFLILLIFILFLLLLIRKYVPRMKPKIEMDKFKMNKELSKIFFISFCSLYAFFHLLTWLPIYLTQEKYMSPNDVATYISLIPAISIFSSLFFSKLVDKFKKIRLFTQILLLFTIISILIFTYSNNRLIIIFALIMYGIFGKLALDPILIIATSKACKHKNLSTTLAVFNFVSLTSSVIAPYIGGKIYSYTNSLNLSFLLSAIILFIAFIVSLEMRKQKKEEYVTYSN